MSIINKPKIYPYSTKKYNFRKMLLDLYNVDDLESIHNNRSELLPTAHELAKPWPLNEGKSKFDDLFYSKLREPWTEFINLYEDFIREYVAPTVLEGFIYQKTPNFRIHPPNGKAVTKWHFDADTDHQHPVGEVNFVIPMTVMKGTAATWMESEYNKEDYFPLDLEYGQFASFNGNRCHHGNKVNTTGKTRISFDFRILPMSSYPPKGLYPESFGGSVWMKTKYDIGGYYKKFEE